MAEPEKDQDALSTVAKEWSTALERMSDEDQRLLRLVRLLGEAVDPRYEMKGIYGLVGRALADPAFRARALENADAVLDEIRGYVELPENVRVTCVENSADHLTVVLPPPSSERSPAIQDLILSRTSEKTVLADVSIDDSDFWPPHTGDVFTGDANFPHFGDVPHDAVPPITL